MIEIELRFQHECPYNDLSKKFPHARISLWDNFSKEFLDVWSSKRDGRRINRELETLARWQGSKILAKMYYGRDYQFMIMACNCARGGTTVETIVDCDCLFVPPISFSEGWETYRIMAFDKKAPQRILEAFRRMGTAVLASQRRVDQWWLDRDSMWSLPNPLSRLTPMQAEALATSMSYGYYRVPRRTSTGKIAAYLGVPRTTFQEHRKKAESKLMAALAPLVLTSVHGSEAKLA